MNQVRRALITGASGFVGSHLAARLVADGWEVHGLHRPASQVGSAPFSGHSFNGSTEGLCAVMAKVRPDVVFHLASLFLTDHTVADVNRLIEGNVLYGTQLAEAMAKAGCRLLVNTGSYWQHREGEEYDPINLYAATKQAMGDILRYYAAACDIQVVTLKLFDSYGPGDRRRKLTNLLCEAARSGAPIEIRDPSRHLDLVYIDDVVEAFVVAGERLLAGEERGYAEYVVRTGDEHSAREVVECFERAARVKLAVTWGDQPRGPRIPAQPWRGGSTMPGWRARISLAEGLERSWRGD